METLTKEDKLFGRKEPRPKTNLELKAFTADTKYTVCAEGSDNIKTVNGLFIERILSKESKEEITNGALEIKANGLVITRIEEQAKTDVGEAAEETAKPKRKRAK